MTEWAEKRILVLGTTYPNYSQKYTEIVCTGGIEEDTFKMIRLHPIPHRYLEEIHRFKAFQWIKVQVTKNLKDGRPESYRVNPNSIELQNVISSEQHADRRYYIEKSPHRIQSIEELKEKQKKDSTSMGIIIPKSISGVDIKMRTIKEREEWIKKESVLLQENMFEEQLKKIDFPEAKFFVKFTCDDQRCEGHEMSLLQWGLHELYRKYKDEPDGKEKVLQEMRRRLNQKEKDIFFFVGNFLGIQYNFGLMDSYSAPICVQESLF